MGLNYFAVNQSNMTAYDLGKGAWSLIADCGNIKTSDSKDLKTLVSRVVDDFYDLSIADKNTLATNITKALAALGDSPIKLISDVGDEWDSGRHTVIGSRYDSS